MHTCQIATNIECKARLHEQVFVKDYLSGLAMWKIIFYMPPVANLPDVAWCIVESIKAELIKITHKYLTYSQSYQAIFIKCHHWCEYILSMNHITTDEVFAAIFLMTRGLPISVFARRSIWRSMTTLSIVKLVYLFKHHFGIQIYTILISLLCSVCN